MTHTNRSTPVRPAARKARNRRTNVSSITAAQHTEMLESRTLMATTPFDVPVQTQGTTPVTLYPIESVAPGVTTRVSFGVPFAKGFVTDLGQVRLLDGATEKSVYVQQLTPWRDMATLTNLASVRSALVQVDVAFPDVDADGDADPVTYTVEWGTTARSVPALAPISVRSNWVQYNNAAAPAGTDYKTADNVWEPPAYALFTPAWYGQSLLKTRLLPAGSDAGFAGYDAAYVNFANTAINEVDPRVTDANLIRYTTTDEPWLFDRATALYQLAFRTGDVNYLRHAHRGAQFYANHISPQGYFDLKGDDLKYVTGEAISIDYWLTGDERMLDVHRRMNPMFDHAQNATYTPGSFWTERHAAYKLLGYVTGYELLGDATLGQKARDTFGTYVNHQNNPPAGAPNTGLLMHRSEDHAEGGTEWVGSPWMSALLVDAVERYYIHSGDARVANFVTRMADGINQLGDAMYYSTAVDGVSRLMPFYLAGPGLTADQHVQDPWGDMEHGTDVSRIFALAYFFTKQAGSPSATYLGRMNELKDTGQAAFNYWTRPGGPAAGLSVYRLTPARKFNWWFRTTANRDFLVGGNVTPVPTVGTVQIGSATYAAGEAAGTFQVSVTRSGDAGGAATVTYATSNGTATAGADYTATTGVLSFAPGETTKSIAIQVLNDTLVEGNETINLTLSAPTGATLGTRSTATLTIASDDAAPLPAVQLAGAAYAAGEGDGVVNVTLSRSGDTSAASSVTVTTSNGSAAAGADYAAVTAVVTFAAGETSKTVAVLLHEDALVEGAETFTVTVHSPAGAVLGARTSAVVTINDNDTAPPPPPPPPAPVTGTISGTLFNDADGNGAITPGEPALTGWPVFLDGDADGVCDAGEPACTAGTDGTYRFDGLLTGNYRVVVPTPAGWVRTTGDDGYRTLSLGEGQVAGNVNFGRALPGSVAGNVFNDRNANGRKDRKEGYMASVRVFLDADNDGVLDAGETSVLTNKGGAYSFTGLLPGTHSVRVVPKTGWKPTLPTNGVSAVAVIGGRAATGILFGLKRIA